MTARGDPDRLIGERIRLRRSELGLTQDQLAGRLGLSYQQIQKYESGASRITVARLLEIALVLDAPLTRFIGDLPGNGEQPGAEAEGSAGPRLLGDLARSLAAIEDDAVRSAVAGLLRAVAERAASG